MYRVPSIFIVGLLLVLVSCETLVDVDLPDQKPQLVVNGLFSPDSTWRVQIMSATPFVASSSIPRLPIENPVIEIWNQNERITNFSLDPTRVDGWYAAPALPIAGETYSIRVSSDGYEPVEGTAKLPSQAQVERFATELVPPGQDNAGRLDFTLTLNDPPAQKNYYGLDMIWETEQFDPATGESSRGIYHTSFRTNDPSLVEPDLFDPDDNYVARVFFTDDLFDGRTHDLEFSIDIAFFPSPDFQIRQRFDIYLFSLSEDMYRYSRTAEQQLDVRDDPFAEPVQIHSNMSNGYGIFAGFQRMRFSVNPDTLVRRGRF